MTDSFQVGSQAAVPLDDYFRRFLNSDVIGVMCSDITGKIFDANDALLAMIGYTRQDVTSGVLRWNTITPPEFAHTSVGAIKQLSETGCAQPFQKEYIHKLGHRVPVTIGVVALDDEGHCLSYIVDETSHKEAIKRLAASEERFRNLTQSIPQLVWTADPGGKVTYANQRFFDYTGISATDRDGFSWQDVVHPDDLVVILKQGEVSAKQHTVFEVEARYRAKNGDYRWQLVRALPMVMSDGSVKWFGTCTDIEDQKRVECELRDAVARSRTMAEAIPQIVWAAEPDGEISFFNQRWFEYSGLSIAQTFDGGWRLLIHPDDIDMYMGEWRNALKSGDSFECKFRLKRAVGLRAPRGGYRAHLCRAVAVRSSTGNVIEWFGTWTDIHEEK